jgi:hypothetical protein
VNPSIGDRVNGERRGAAARAIGNLRPGEQRVGRLTLETNVDDLGTKSAIYNLQSAICNLQFQDSYWRFDGNV